MDIERILEYATTVKLQMGVLQRRVQGKPGHQGIMTSEILANARFTLDLIENELTRADQDIDGEGSKHENRPPRT